MLTIGIIGCGAWAQLMHVPALQTLIAEKKICVAAVSDINHEQATKCAQALNCDTIFSDYQEMLDDPDLARQCDALSILVPYHISENIIASIAKRNIPFLCEKPPASNALEHRKLINLVGNTPHIIAYNRRFSPYIMAAREWMRNQNIQSVSAEFCRHQRCEAGFSSTFVHGLDTTLNLLGDAVSGHAYIQHQDQVCNIGLSLQTANGAFAQILIAPNTGDNCEHYNIRSATRSAIVAFPQFGMRDLPGYVELYEKNTRIKRITPVDCNIHNPQDMPALGGIVAEYNALILCVKNGHASPSTLSSTLNTQLVREAIDAVSDRDGTHSLNLASEF